MIYITGDTHRQEDWSKLNSKNFYKGKELTRDDYVIICGDFGGVWTGDNSDDVILDWYENKPWTTLFVDGNHENHAALSQYPIEMWHGGKIHRIKPHVIHLMRGQVYTIDNKTFFVMGGAESVDKHLRKENISWWANEMPSNEEYEEGFINLQKHNDSVDYILAHCAPDSIQDLISYRSYTHNRITNYLEITVRSVKFSHFYCGHYHIDKDIGKYSLLYQTIRPLD